MIKKRLISLIKCLKNSSELQNEFAKAKYGKDFTKLNQQEKQSIQAILESRHQDKSVELLAKENTVKI